MITGFAIVLLGIAVLMLAFAIRSIRLDLACSHERHEKAEQRNFELSQRLYEVELANVQATRAKMDDILIRLGVEDGGG